MAFTGLAKITVAKLDESTDTPSYTDGFRCGKAIELTIDRKYAEGSLDGDNVQAEYDKEFRYADVNLNTTTLPIKAHSVMFGHTVTESEEKISIKEMTTDESNYVGVGCCVQEKVDNVRKYIGMWMYKAKFSEGQETYKTRGENIEYQTPTITGRAVGLPNYEWRDREVFDTEQAAQDWIDEKAGLKAQPSGV